MKNFKRIMALVLTVVLSIAMTGCYASGIETEGEPTQLVQQINATGKYLTKKISAPTYGDENAIIGLTRSTYIDFWHKHPTNYVNKINHFIKSNGYVLGEDHQVYADGYPDVILAVTTCGIYANWSSATDLLEGISFDNVVMMGGYLNKVDALTALECGKYSLVDRGDLTRQDLIDFTMEMQLADGSFSYADMGEVSKIEVTSSAVTGLILSGEKDEVEQAANSGVEYLIANVSENDKPVDIVKAVIALNTAGVDATDVDGKDLIGYIMEYARDDGSFSFDKSAKKGNKSDSAWALLALASQYRFQQGMTSIYDMSDVLGGTHNQLSPEWMLYVKIMIAFMIFMGVFMIGLLIKSRFTIAKWKREGIWDEEKKQRLSDAEIAAKKAAEAAAQPEEAVQTTDETK